MPRPRPVTLFASLALLVASSYLFTGIMLYLGKINLDDFASQVPQIAEMKETFLQAALVFSAVFGFAYLAAGIGLLLMKDWARALARGLAVFALLGALVQMIQSFTTQNAGGFLFSAMGAGIAYWAFYYLGQPRARAAFGPPPPAGSPPSPPAPPGPDSVG